MSSLVVVESPAKCKKIASFLGPGFTVLATMGHIRALEEDLGAIGIDRDFEPRFRFLNEKSKATRPIIEAAQKAKTIFLAADDDREGEAIAYSVACLLKRDPLSFPRSVFHEITEKAVKHAIANPMRIDMNRVYAQQARSVLDMLVGFTISPLLWKHVARGLSAGRCQTPALRLVSDREKEVQNHSMQTTWAIRGEIRSSGFDFSAKMDDELEDQESALNYLENIHADSGCFVQDVVEKSWTANPPKPLITSSLQQEASALHKLNPKVTMKIAQTLYEAGHITYMRTDHAVLGEEAIESAKEEVKKRYGEKYVGDAETETPKPKTKTKAKVKKEKEKEDASASTAPAQAQEAHEAIRPTHFDLYELPSDDWGDVEKKVYNLIYRRAMQSVMAPATGKNRTATLVMSADCDKFPWSAKWRRTEFEGWQILGTPAKLDKNDDEEEEEKEEETIWKKAQLLKKGMVLRWLSIQALPKRSRSSPRYTEATLIRELEKRGIGRPSTFASLVEVLFDKEYVEKKDIAGTKIFNTSLHIVPNTWPPLTQNEQITLGAEKQKIVSTTLGESVITFCLREFPQLFAYEFTNGMETRLDKISKGEEAWKLVCHDTWNSYKKDHERLQDKASVPSASEKVQDFGDGFKAVSSKSGLLLVQEGTTKKDKATFYTFPPDHTMQTITKEAAKAWIEKQITDATYGTYNHKPIMKKKGPYGEYLECDGLRIPFVDSDTSEMIVEKFKLRSQNNSTGYKFGPYTFSTGQYGPYMFKHDLKTKIFVSVPATIDPKKLTAEEADTLYKNGVEAKKAKGAFRGGRGGRGGGRR